MFRPVSGPSRHAAFLCIFALVGGIPAGVFAQSMPGVGRPGIPSTGAERFAGDEEWQASLRRAQAQSDAIAGKALRGPVDENLYVVGPGDGFSITIWAQVAQSFAAVVTPEGRLVIPGVATIPVAGKKLAEASALVRTEIARQYRNVEVSIALVELRLLEVSVVGNVVHPGTYVATAMDPASRIIELAGGTGPKAGRRNIEIRRRTGGVTRVDLVRFERTGDLEANPPILDADVVAVPWIKNEVVVEGAVESPGVYEFVEGDTVESLVAIAGGTTRDARRDSVEIRRFIDFARTEEILVSLESGGGSTRVQDGDQIYVRSLVDWKEVETVVLEGEFLYPGPYGIEEGRDLLSDVIRRAGGFTEHASLGETQLIRTRGKDPIDLEYERLKLIPVQDMSEKEYAYFKTKSRERKGQVVVDFERLLAGDEAHDRVLSGGDRVVAPRRRATITVSGSVTFPGLITYAPEMRPAYYIELAGGYSSNADRGGARVVRGLTGEWEPLSKVREVIPGDEIWVPEKAERKWWPLARETVAFVASIATVYLVIDQATN